MPDQVRENRANATEATTPRTSQKAALVAAAATTNESASEPGASPPATSGWGAPARWGTAMSNAPPTFATTLGAREQQPHAGRGAHDREQPPELAVEEAARERARKLGAEPDRRVHEEDEEAGRAPEEPLAPGRAPAPGEDRDDEEREPDGGRDVRDARPERALDAVVGRPRATVVVAVAVSVGGAGPGRRVAARRRRGPVAGRNERMTVVLVRTIPPGMGVGELAVAVREETGVPGPRLVRLRREEKWSDGRRLEAGERHARHRPGDDGREENPPDHRVGPRA